MKIRRPSHATVVAYLALFTALGGSAYAVSKIGTADLQRGAVTSAKIDNGDIRAKDLKPLVLRSQRAEVGPGSPPGTRVGAIAECKKGEKVVAGGGHWATFGPGNEPTLVTSAPFGRIGWRAQGTPGTDANTFIATALCMRK